MNKKKEEVVVLDQKANLSKDVSRGIPDVAATEVKQGTEINIAPAVPAQPALKEAEEAVPQIKIKKLSKKWLLFFALFLFVFITISLVVVKNMLPKVPYLLGKKGEIVWWGLQEEEAVVAPLIKEFQENNPDVRITYLKQSPKDYGDRLASLFKEGKGPDIFEIHDSWIPDFRDDFSKLPSSIMNEEEYAKTFLTPISSTLLTKKGIVGFPLSYDAIALYINENMFSVAGKELPKTWDDVVTLSDPNKGQLTIRGKNNEIIQSAIALGNTSNVDNWQEVIALMLVQNGVNLSNPTGTRAQDVFKYYANFSRNGVWNNRLPPSTLFFSKGSLAMYFGTVSRAPEILKENSNLRFRTVAIPQLPKNSPNDPDYSYASFWLQAVWNKSTNENVAWKFLKFMTEKTSIEKSNAIRKSIKGIEMPPPRNDMVFDYIKHPIIGSVMGDAAVAKTWYLAGNADDGGKGINTNVANIFSTIIQKEKVEDATLLTLKKTLSSYGITVK